MLGTRTECGLDIEQDAGHLGWRYGPIKTIHAVGGLSAKLPTVMAPYETKIFWMPINQVLPSGGIGLLPVAAPRLPQAGDHGRWVIKTVPGFWYNTVS